MHTGESRGPVKHCLTPAYSTPTGRTVRTCLAEAITGGTPSDSVDIE